MKKQTKSAKLKLDLETIRILVAEKLTNVAGGGHSTNTSDRPTQC